MQIARYGLPLIILIFYVTVSLAFAYTPESTFLFLQAAGGVLLPDHAGSSPSPLWHLLVTVGGWLRLDEVLTVKVFSLLFCSFAVLCAYLFAVEAISDRVAGLFVALCVAVEPWLLQLGPSGNALSLALALSLAVLLFTKRGDYHVASLLAGLCTLVLWQGVGLLFVVVAEMFLNPAVRKQGLRPVATALLPFLSVVVAWLIYCIVFVVPAVPALVPFGEFPKASIPEVVVLVLLGGMMVVGIAAWAKLTGHAGYLVRMSISAWMWIVWLTVASAISGVEIALLAIPVLVTYAFFGLKILLIAVRSEHLLYTAALVLSVVFILECQMQFTSMTRPLMRDSIQASQVLKTAASWLRGVADNEATVAAEKPGIVGFYSARSTRPLEKDAVANTDFIVTAARKVQGYDVVYLPGQGDSSMIEGPHSHVAVWRRK